jgi:hypothetical protein
LAASRLGIILAVVAVRAAIAQDATMQEVAVDPPGRVARLSFIEGQVSLGPAESEDWTDAVLNRPLTSGDKLWLDRDARAELETGSATVHLDHGTGFRFVQLDDAVMLMSLTEGAASVRVRDLAERERVQVETPNAAVLLRRPGEYQFEVDPGTDRTIVRARSGEAEIRGGGARSARSYVLRANEEGVFTGLDDLRAQIGVVAPRTAFESWAYDRAQDEDRAVSSRYVSREVVGYEDLDDYGEWLHEPAYGYVWRPLHVGYGWAPYRFGRWVWIRPWGWTWIDDARWGFAPFHYGRWLQLRNHWCWVPGPRHLRPVYAPALVGWVGGAYPRFSASPGRVGWFPLAPHEVYVPAYRHTPRYIRRVNLANTVIADTRQISSADTARDRQRELRYRASADAVTTAQQDRFATEGRAVGEGRLRLSERELREARDEPRSVSSSRGVTRSRPQAATQPRDTRPSGEVKRDVPQAQTRPAVESPRTPSAPQRSAPAAERSQSRDAPAADRQSQPRSSRANPPGYRQQ